MSRGHPYSRSVAGSRLLQWHGHLELMRWDRRDVLRRPPRQAPRGGWQTMRPSPEPHATTTGEAWVPRRHLWVLPCCMDGMAARMQGRGILCSRRATMIQNVFHMGTILLLRSEAARVQLLLRGSLRFLTRIATPSPPPPLRTPNQRVGISTTGRAHTRVAGDWLTGACERMLAEKRRRRRTSCNRGDPRLCSRTMTRKTVPSQRPRRDRAKGRAATACGAGVAGRRACGRDGKCLLWKELRLRT